MLHNACFLPHIMLPAKHVHVPVILKHLTTRTMITGSYKPLCLGSNLKRIALFTTSRYYPGGISGSRTYNDDESQMQQKQQEPPQQRESTIIRRRREASLLDSYLQSRDWEPVVDLYRALVKNAHDQSLIPAAIRYAWYISAHILIFMCDKDSLYICTSRPVYI